MDMIASALAKLGLWYQSQTRADLWWLALGLGGQLMFTGRWFIQWIASEKGNSLDIAWLKDDSDDDAADLPEPAVLAREAAEELNAALVELGAILAELEAP